MAKIITGAYGLRNPVNGDSYFAEGAEIYAKTTAIGTCRFDDTGDRKESEVSYDYTPVILRAGATSINVITPVNVSDNEIEICWN